MSNVTQLHQRIDSQETLAMRVHSVMSAESYWMDLEDIQIAIAKRFCVRDSQGKILDAIAQLIDSGEAIETRPGMRSGDRQYLMLGEWPGGAA